MGDRLLKMSEVSRLVSLGRSSIFQRVRENRFPAPIKLGKHNRWQESQVQAFVRAAIRGEYAAKVETR